MFFLTDLAETRKMKVSEPNIQNMNLMLRTFKYAELYTQMHTYTKTVNPWHKNTNPNSKDKTWWTASTMKAI